MDSITSVGRMLLCSGVALLLASIASAMERVRVETRVDQAVAKFGLSGSNTLVAIMDRGIDWRHPDFRNPDGSTRIEAIFDLTDESGAHDPANPFGVGTLCSRAQIEAALGGGAALLTRDAVGHGTTTAGIACGGGMGNPQFRGIAPGARMLVIKIASDGAPAHDGETAELPFNRPELFPVAIDFATSKAAELKLPCVMLLNLGSVGGPTDGTSFLCRKIDSTVGPGRPGLAFVTGSSDDGSAPNRVSGIVAPGETAEILVEKTDRWPLFVDLWYTGEDRFDLEIETPSGRYGPYLAPAENSGFESITELDFFYYHLGSDVDGFQSDNAKREIYLRLDGLPGTYRMRISGALVRSGAFDATLNPSRFDPSGRAINRFLNFLAPGSLWDGATAFHNICPNSYVIRTNYADIDGIARRIEGEGVLGGLWKGSGVGPTFDGRLGIDVSAPGDSLITCYNPSSYWATFRFNLIHGGQKSYGRASAVSAANPIVAGIVALMLEMNPQLDAGEIKRILQETARSDAFTGATPNTDWGYGKVDALAALNRVWSQSFRLEALPFKGQQVRLKIRGVAGGRYALESGSDLRTWQRVRVDRLPASEVSVDLPQESQRRFFRLSPP